MIAFGPIIIILLIIGLSVFMFKRSRKKTRTYLSNAQRMKLLGGYMIIMLLSAVICTFIPDDKSSAIQPAKKTAQSHEHQDLYNLAIDGTPNKIDPSFITDHWEKDYHQQVLNLSLKNGDSFDPMIVIEKKPVNDHKIEGTFYQTPSIINGMDVTKRMPAPHLEWSQDTLTFTSIKKTIKLTLIKKEFPIEQFTGKTSTGQ